MLLRTVAPSPSGCDSARNFLATSLGFSKAETAASEDDDDDMIRAGSRERVAIRKKKSGTIRRRIRSLWVLLVGFCSCEARRWVLVLILANAEEV